MKVHPIGAFTVECPRCHSSPGYTCRTVNFGGECSVHQARLDKVGLKWFEQIRLEEKAGLQYTGKPR
jgi:hypothetical protein